MFRGLSLRPWTENWHLQKFSGRLEHDFMEACAEIDRLKDRLAELQVPAETPEEANRRRQTVLGRLQAQVRHAGGAGSNEER